MRTIPPLQVLSGGGSIAERRADDEARERALAVLLLSYRKADADAGDFFVDSLARVLRKYPLDVVLEVCDPAGEFRCSWKWIPDSAELNTACGIINTRKRRREDRDRSIREQLAERDERERELAAKPSQTREEFDAEMAARGLPIDRPEQRVEASVVKAKYGLSEAQWDAIPDLPDSHEDRAAKARAANRLPPGDAARAVADLAARKALASLGEKRGSARSPIERAIEREYAVHGVKPVMAGSMIVSPSLVKALGEWRCGCHRCSQWQGEP
jgi:hypothetical protein